MRKLTWWTPWKVAPLMVVMIALASCGGSSHGPTVHPVRAAAGGHKCSVDDYFMQCALPPTPKALAPVGVSAIAYGWDFWGSACPAPGNRFGATYFSYDSSKNWSRWCAARYREHVGVWETGATRATQGWSAGVADARAAAGQAAAVGNTTRPIDFAIDCDCSGPQVSGYFQGVHHVLGTRDDAYGGYYPLLWLFQHGLVGHENWQTYAWSGGRWLPASIAPLEQYLNDNSVDYDRAIAPLYGQWPVANPLPVCLTHRISKAECAKAKRQIASWQRALTASRRAYDQRACPVLAQRITWFAGRLKAHPHFKTTPRKQALAASRTAYRRQNCSLFAARVGLFTSLVGQERKRF